MLALICVPFPVLADEVDVGDVTRGQVTQLSEGQVAPFRGVLLSQEAAASLFGDLKFSKKECNLRLDRELKLNTETWMAQLNSLNLRLEVEQKRADSLLEIKNERIQFLEKNWQPGPWYQSGEFWLATGAVLGIVVTVAAGYAVGQAGNN